MAGTAHPIPHLIVMDDVPNYVGIVRAVKQELVGKGLNVDADETSRADITFRAADRIHHVDERVGLLFKDSGNQVQQRAVDILCFPDGTIVDILGAGSEGPNTPLWMVNAVKVDPGRWRAPFSFAAVAPPEVPTAPTPAPAPTPQLPVPVPPTPVPPAPPSPVGPVVTKAVALGFLSALLDALAKWWTKKRTP